VLLIGAGLFVRSLQKPDGVDPGFAHGELMQVSINPHLLGYDEPRLRGALRPPGERLAAMPGVRSVSLAIFGPLTRRRARGNVSVPGAPLACHGTENARCRW
jgi:hypothetical protein